MAGKSPPSGRLLLVEDEPLIAAPISELLAARGHRVAAVHSLEEARALLKKESFDLMLLDVSLPDGSGFELLEDGEVGPATIMLTADHSVNTAIQALRRGAHDYLTKPFDTTVLLHRVERVLEHRTQQAGELLRRRVETLHRRRHPRPESRSRAMKDLYREVLLVGESEHEPPVLVSGETGAGKEHVCRLIHDSSARRDASFVALNCGELDRRLLRSELFGHERGAFTGATERHRGLFELAKGGTLLLDEVAEMPLEVQAALLRVLETGRFRRVGGSEEIEADVRLIAASNKDLRRLAEAGELREDLLYRLNAIALEVPPLRRRVEDIEPLARLFCGRFTRRGKTLDFTDEALGAMRSYPWPGNVRELRNVVERAVVVSRGEKIDVDDLALDRHPKVRSASSADSSSSPSAEDRSPDSLPTLEQAEQRLIRRALERFDGNRTQAAKALGIARSTLIRKLSKD